MVNADDALPPMGPFHYEPDANASVRFALAMLSAGLWGVVVIIATVARFL